jgi:type I restriction enzyme S subunit
MVEEKVREGYKRTEVGVIPEDWDLKMLGEISECLDRYRIPLNESQRNKMKGDIPYCGANGIVDYVDDYCIDDDIILLAEDGGHFSEYKTRPIAYRMTGKLWVNNHVHIIKALSEYSQEYLFYTIVNKNILDYITGGTRAKLNQAALKKIVIPMPKNNKEQKAIAEVLSDTDNLITSLEKLINKKEKIKKGAMQKLLTGQERLPGFDGEWEEKELGEICKYITDGTHHTPKYVKNGIPFYSVENVTDDNFTNTKYISNKEHLKLIRRCFPEEGDILMTRIGTLGKTKLITWDINASIYVSLALLKLNEKIYNKYFYEYSKYNKFVQSVEKRSLMNATPKKINMGEINGIPIPVPPLQEQKAIAQILSDMDAEIEALNKKLEKYKKIKQGMMEELLTGRIRLV